MQPSGELTRRELQLHYAFALLRDGTRPTADALVAQYKGSKSSAVAVLDEFWSQWLPTRLAPSQMPTPPDPVQQALARVWHLAKETAEKDLAGREAALHAERAKLAAQRAQLCAERDELTAALQAARAQAGEARRAVQDLQARLATRNEQLADDERRLTALADAKAEVHARARALEESLRGLPELERRLAETALERDESRAALAQLERTRAADLEALRQAHSHERYAWQGQLDDANAGLAAARAALSQAQQGVLERSADAESSRAELQNALTQVAVLQSRLETTASALDAERALRSAAEQGLGKAHARLDTAEQARTVAEAEIARLRALTDGAASKPPKAKRARA